MSCHVMSCHVAIVVSILKNHSQKLFHFTKLFINILQASLLVIWIATPHFTKGGQTPVRLAMTKKILSLRGSGTTEVIHNRRGFINLDCLPTADRVSLRSQWQNDWLNNFYLKSSFYFSFYIFYFFINNLLLTFLLCIVLLLKIINI